MLDKNSLPQPGNVTATLSYLRHAEPGDECDHVVAALPALSRLMAVPAGLSQSLDIVAMVVEQLSPGHVTLAWGEKVGEHVCIVSLDKDHLDDFRWCARGRTLAIAYLSAAMAMVHGLPPGWHEH